MNVKRLHSQPWRGLCLVTALIFFLAACTPAVPTPLVITVVVPASPVPVTGGVTAPTADSAPTLAATSSAETPTAAQEAAADTATPVPQATTGPQCTIQQNVNFRAGPGKAYEPPLDALVKGTVVIPQGYQAQGYPGGSWVQVLNPGSSRLGWVSAGTDFITCTVDLASLPSVDILPTPTPSAPRVSNSQPEGTFDTFTWKLHTSGIYLMRMEVYQGDGSTKDGDNIQSITFRVTKDGKQLREQVEHNAPFCIFGGDNTCAAWPKENGHLVWKPGGDPVQSGDYFVNIDGETKDGSASANWHFTLTLKVP